MPSSDIVVKGAREHNLRDVDLVLPRNQLICLTGVSGSGKSSLAFDTIYAEGQRRYVESLSSYARHLLGQMPKPDVDFLGGLSPSISISQKSTGHNPRSTVGTVTEIYDYLRVLYARVGDGFCPKCERPISSQSREEIVQRILSLEPGMKFTILAPLIRGQKGEHRDLFESLLKQGFARARVDGQIVALTDSLSLDRQMRHDIEVAIDRLAVRPDMRTRIAESVELGIRLGKGTLIVAPENTEATVVRQPDPEFDESEDEEEATSAKARTKTVTKTAKKRGPKNPGDIVFSVDYACTHCNLSFEPPSPQLFSFNSPQGMCPNCAGLGYAFTFAPDLLIPDTSLSFKDGAVEIIGTWKDLGRWRRHIYQGVADTMERKLDLESGTLLETPWKKLKPSQKAIWLEGTGDEHITFTWKGGNSPMKYGGRWDGIVPELLDKYRETKSGPHIKALEKYMSTVPCSVCHGERLLPQARAVKITTEHADFADKPTKTLPEVCRLSIRDAEKFFSELTLSPTRTLIATEVLKEIRSRLGFLLNVGLEYLTLDRGAPTLSGGETQRIRLASQIGSGLVGVLYILDEPSIGLHPRDNDRLLSTLHRLRDMGNTVVVVEHDEDTMWAADHIVDFGPGPGVRGGQMVAHGKPQTVADTKASVTGAYLSGRRKIEIPKKRRPIGDKWLKVIGAKHHNLRNVDVEIPLGVFVCVTGVSGSGKSSVVNDILVETLRRDLNGGEGEPGAHDRIEGMEHLDKLIAIDQTPIGRTPRSNPGTYIKLFDDIRDLFAELPEAKRRGFKPGRFSFNVEGGRCEACEGNGSNKLEMEFLADVWVTCTVCEGKRFSRETLQVRFKGKSIADVLDMDVQQALELFENVPNIRHKLQTLHDVGLDYLKIGQPSPTLSGGEAQRIKLARELAKRSTGKTLYLLDEPTTGLHFADIELLLKVLHRFCDEGNTVLVVEHNLDVIKTADWVVDLGPEGGQGGGELVVAGTPETVAKCSQSYTGKSLVPVLEGRAAEVARDKAKETIAAHQALRKNGKREGLLTHVDVRGAKQHNLKEVSCRIPRDAMTVFCGPSGSGKSSLAMDTIYAEGQRRYVESLSAYARQFVAQMQKPAVESIEGLSPAIAIEQKNLGNTPRSTVGTVTEVYDYLRIMMARLGQPYCPTCDKPVGTQTPDEITDKILSEPDGTKLYIAAPLDVENSGPPQQLWEELKQRGYARVRVNGTTYALEEAPTVDRRRKQKIEIVLDRISVSQNARSRIAGSVESALSLGKGVLHVVKVHDTVPEPKWETIVHSQHMVCGSCGRSFEPLSPHNFSFNSQLGWCPTCEGLGTQTGANPAALLRDPKLTLAEGALAIWPQLSLPIARSMLDGLSEGTGIPLDVPFEQLAARYRRIILHGTGDQWFSAKTILGEPKPLASESSELVAATSSKKKAPKKKAEVKKAPAPREVSFQFQFKGLYPSLEEASRLSPQLRMRLDQFIGEVECGTCAGSRLRDDSSAVQFRGKTIDEICRLPMGELQKMIQGWTLTDRERKVAGELLREIMGRVEFLNDVGLEYLSLARPAATLSNGEAQRIRLASQLGSGLCGVLYVLDEPTIGLHPRDNTKLLKAMHKLRDLGNTLLVVEHDREVIENCDQLLDFGPGAGKLGGQVVASGTPKEVATQPNSITGPFLSGEESIPVIKNRRAPNRKLGSNQSWPYLSVVNARHNNLKNVNVDIPLGTFTAITGPSGSGKSTLIEDVLYAALARLLHRAAVHPGAVDRIDGVEHINKVIRVDQQPLGNSPASNPATYTGAFELIRDLFSQLPDSKLRGYNARRFSFNVAGGRCEACEGYGQKRIEMHFLADVWVECETCRGQRYTPETLAVKFHGHSISDVLNSTCGEALRLFENIPKIRRVLQTLCDVGLDYLTLGQPAPTLSGGEAQRVKLAAELARPDTGRTLYLLDEPTTGLHFEDISKLLEVLQRLVDLGNTVVVIEHNLDVIKTCDWVIDLGPEAGDGGGRIVAAGTPETVIAHADAALNQLRQGTKKKAVTGKPATSSNNGDGAVTLYRSYTGEALKPVLEAGPFVERKTYDPFAEERPKEGDLDIAEVGSTTQMPWEVDGRRWHTQDRVGRKGEACRWDGRILAEVIDRIQAAGDFAETNYNARSVVEITGQTKSEGWFFHAITGEAWLVKMKFRVYRGTFKGSDLQERIPLKTLNQLEDLPLYGNEPRLKVKSTQGPFQEVEIRAHSYEEVNVPGFWTFIDEAVAGFFKFTEKASVAKETLSPWKVLGQKWHFLRKGFPPGKKVSWSADTLEELCDLLNDICEGQFLWNNQQVVHLIPKGRREPWASIWTKRPQSVMLCLTGPKGKFGFGRVVEFGKEPALDEEKDRDVIKLQFSSVEQLHQPGVKEFLQEHLQAVLSNK